VAFSALPKLRTIEWCGPSVALHSFATCQSSCVINPLLPQHNLSIRYHAGILTILNCRSRPDTDAGRVLTLMLITASFEGFVAQKKLQLALDLRCSGAHSTVVLAAAEQTGELVAIKLVPRGAGSQALLCSR
jgi:hypothetical protein